MKNILSIVQNKECCGCSSCSNSCPLSIIEMKPDDEGFLSPFISDLSACIECGHCIKVCPMSSAPKYYPRATATSYIAHTKDFESARHSASGGAFWGIASYFIREKQAIVFGAAYTTDLVVKHISVKSLSDLYKLQNSKYVQSDMGECYKEIEYYLKKGRTILFSGTPCQIDGLYRFLQGRKYENLYTVDIVCHGVPSPLFFQTHLQSISEALKRNVTSVQFRNKKPYKNSRSLFLLRFSISGGGQLFLNSSDEYYFRSFLRGVAFRESCYHCLYARQERIADFTLGDCDSAVVQRTHFLKGMSKSIVLCNSSKAYSLWSSELCKEFFFTPLDLDVEAHYNTQLSKPFARPAQRDDFYKKSLKRLLKKRGLYFATIKGAMLLYLPDSIISFLVSIKNRK